jgi:hypothetical protein
MLNPPAGWPLQALIGGFHGFLATHHHFFDGCRGDLCLQLPDRGLKGRSGSAA